MASRALTRWCGPAEPEGRLRKRERGRFTEFRAFFLCGAEKAVESLGFLRCGEGRDAGAHGLRLVGGDVRQGRAEDFFVVHAYGREADGLYRHGRCGVVVALKPRSMTTRSTPASAKASRPRAVRNSK